MYIKKCPHCNIEKEYKNHQQFGAHVTNCKENPNYEKRLQKIKESLGKSEKNLKFEYIITCKSDTCDNEFKLLLTKNLYEKGKYKKFCSPKCASAYSRSFMDTDKLKESTCINCGSSIQIKLNSDYNVLCEKCKLEINEIKKICNKCGKKNCDDKRCKSFNKGRKRVFTKLGFDNNTIGTTDFHKEFDRIVHLIEDEYKSKSLTEIGEKYNLNFQTIQSLMIYFSIERRNLSDSNRIAILNGRWSLPEHPIYPYKSGRHEKWNGGTIWYRSSYELEYCEYLDKMEINYEVESMRLEYFDTQLNKNRIAIPDFYLPDTNTIIEIKSTYTYDPQNMKDKFKSYREKGYKAKLILDKKEEKI